MDADDAVLVVLVNRPRDLAIVRAERWYRIPAQHAPAHLSQANYLAFYLPKCFGAEKWTIREYAPVRGHELVSRRDLLPDESDHPRASDPYYKVELGPVLALPRPIVSRTRRRLLFLWTTGARFSRAVEIDDLFRKAARDDALWEMLDKPDAGQAGQRMAREARTRYRVDYWLATTHLQRGVTP
ncbi:MAG: hypothetical protein HY782_28735 [Chloroflexi bacterium]|nr:hypothetical protein [Chloroflexota bacterium]